MILALAASLTGDLLAELTSLAGRAGTRPSASSW